MGITKLSTSCGKILKKACYKLEAFALVIPERPKRTNCQIIGERSTYGELSKDKAPKATGTSRIKRFAHDSHE